MFYRKLKAEKGVSIVLLAISAVVLIGFAALAIDIGHLYHVKDQLQVAADGAALAGVGELNGANDDAKKANALAAAIRIAARNTADVASTAISTASPGAGIPVTLDPAYGVDVVAGNWDNTLDPHFGPNRTPLNAVMVIAKRTGAQEYQPRATNWFGRIFALLGANYDLTSISATAIAAKVPLPILPIAVNEYWDEVVGKPGGAYGQVYPQSFMRQTNAIASDGSSNGAGRAGQIFAILGTEANSNNSAFNLNSFVDILHRNRFHLPVKSQCPNVEDGLPNLPASGTLTAWWSVKTPDTTTGSCSPTCANNLIEETDGVKTGDVNPGKYDQNFQYLFSGIPDNVIVPNAVFEIARPTPPYPDDNYNNGNDTCYQATFASAQPPLIFPPVNNNYNDPSNCPYASIPYFAGSGVGPVGKKLNVEDDPFDGKKFWQVYPKGSRFIVMVYDGTIQANPDPSQANVVTVIGYGIIEIDGYKNGPFNGNPNSLNPGGTGNSAGGTAYGHAIPHNVAGQTDPYLIQPPSSPANQTSSSARKGSCSFTSLIRDTANNFGGIRLVGVSPDVRYGTQD